MSSVLLCPIGKYGQCAAGVRETAGMTVDASCQLCAYFQHESVNTCSTVIACMACTLLLQLLHLGHSAESYSRSSPLCCGL